MSLLLSFITNIFTIVGIAAAGSLILTKHLKYRNLVWGILFGIGAIILTRECILLFPGRTVGFRYILMTLSGFFGGITSAVIAGFIHAAYRWTQGGIGTITGITVTFIFGFIGCYLRRFTIQHWDLKKHLLLSCILTTIMLVISLITSFFSFESLLVVQTAALYLYSLGCIGSYFGFTVFFALQDSFENQRLLKKQNHLLHQTQKLFNKAFNLNPNLMLIIRDRKYVDANISFLKITGLAKEEIIGLPIQDLHILVDDNVILELGYLFRRDGKIYNYETKYNTPLGPRAALLSVERLEDSFFLAVMVDVEDKKRQEENIARLEKLNLIGEMAAGIGHEVRNPLTTVRGYLQMFKAKSNFKQYDEQFQTMIDELDRANSIITEYLSLAKNKSTEMTYCDLNSIIHSLYPLIQAEALRLGHDIQIVTGNVPKVKLDQKEIRQLVLNLTRNSLEAMDTAGVITIKTYLFEEKVTLEIQDTGCGIPDKILAKIGTPFITTKDNGTGLGLPVCYRIAQRHNAIININTSNQGTSFFVKFLKSEAVA